MRTMFLGGSNCGQIYNGPRLDMVQVSKKLETKVTSLAQTWVDKPHKPERYLLKEVGISKSVRRYFLVSENMSEDAFLKKAAENINFGCDQYGLEA
ncbi:hypothetical protein ACI8B_60117 [Acinetobacter proteolyticus]|uniref:Uncharacterized protein n=1 Tax=Acinetobacter proteolyticus TaxID=1776741 RepID=A0A653KBK3_9GAMM|nr:hypothetical protein [Acinetobacter proteolyticus]VXA58275.1 hypothetical protein ACI8B_60117 [Acinetobacter proteolyticus]